MSFIAERVKIEGDGVGGFIKIPTKFQIWIEPVANGRTPMCEALNRTKAILEKWVKDHPNSYPPTVINLTDGEPNDGDPRPHAEALKSLSTADGNVTLLTIHASSNQFAQQVTFTDGDEVLPDVPSKLMYEMSSLLTPNMIKNAESLFGTKLPSNSKGFVYNAPLEKIIETLAVGTLPANMR